MDEVEGVVGVCPVLGGVVELEFAVGGCPYGLLMQSASHISVFELCLGPVLARGRFQ